MDFSDVRQSVFAVFRNSLFDDYFSIIVSNDPLDFSKNAIVDSIAELCYTCFR